MTVRRTRATTAIQLETLEGRIPLSATAHPLHALATAHHAPAHVAQVHESSKKAPAIPNPVLVNLTPGTTGVTITDVSYDARIHLITVKGTIAVPPTTYSPYYPYETYYPSTSYLGVTASQSVDRLHSVSGFQSTYLTVADASVTSVKFQESIVATAGEFKGGNVVLSVTSSINYYYNYSYSSQSVIAHMRNAKAY